MRTSALTILILLLLSALAGCLQADPGTKADLHTSAAVEEGGVKGGPAPSAPDVAYRVVATSEEDSGAVAATAYPLTLETSTAKAPITTTREGAFEPGQCSPSESLPLPVSDYHRYDVSEALEENDVFRYEIELKFVNTDESWGDLHLSYGIGGSHDYWWDSVGDERGEIIQNFTGQGYRMESDERAWVAVSCWYGLITRPIAYTITVTYTFGENAVPAEVPLLVNVPEGATRLFATGVPLDAAQGVLSHYRVFGPEDELLCECALSSDEATDAFPLPGPGEFVVLVDHTANGFVALALDAPPTDPLVPLATAWTTIPLLVSDGRSVDDTLQVDLPRVPLDIEVWYRSASNAPAEAGGGKEVHLQVTNARGEVLRATHGDFTMFAASPPGWRTWQSLPGSQWEEHVDHHAFDNGPHQVRVQAEWFRGQINFSTLAYVRA